MYQFYLFKKTFLSRKNLTTDIDSLPSGILKIVINKFISLCHIINMSLQSGTFPES